MLIITEVTKEMSGKDLLLLDCYSYNRREFESVYFVVGAAQAKLKTDNLSNDKQGRFGLRFLLLGRDIKKLATFLKVSFNGGGKNPVTLLNGGESFRCEKVSVLDNHQDCETIYADDQHTANVRCALLANNKGWFGGVAKRGHC